MVETALLAEQIAADLAAQPAPSPGGTAPAAQPVSSAPGARTDPGRTQDGCPSKGQIQAVLALFDEGATVPFIARYRKERTGGLDEVEIRSIEQTRETVERREGRRAAIRAELEKQGVLSPELERRLAAAASAAELEDLYAPYRPKRKTRASTAAEAGLTPVAAAILLNRTADPGELALRYCNAEAGFESAERVLAGAGDIIAEVIAEHPDIRAAARELFEAEAVLAAQRKRGVTPEGEALQFQDYFEHSERAGTAPSHRVLAMFRGEKAGVLSVSACPRAATVHDMVLAMVLRRGVAYDHLGPEFTGSVEGGDVVGAGDAGGGAADGGRPQGPAVAGAYNAACHELLERSVTDACDRLLIPAMESEFRSTLRKRAESTAIAVFARNLEELLMAPPLPNTAILAIDPGLRTGCKVACLDRHGDLVATATIYPLKPHNKTEAAAEQLRKLVTRHAIGAVAVGNGTGGRDVQHFVESLSLDAPMIPVNESGASVYSASRLAREEFPEQDVAMRGAISIGRRLADPLSELVKIDPKSIGVGQYQHDVHQKALKRALDDTVLSCVNRVGVDLATASAPLLSYVSGLSARLARAIVEHRSARGGFTNRRQLLEVTGFGEKTFEQAAGFLRVRNGDEPLDAGAVHPERYELVRRMATDLGVTVAQLIAEPDTRRGIELERYADGEVGIPTLKDIMQELEKPGRDPRGVLEPVRFADVHTLEDLTTGMKLPGIVTNIAAFGAFVDIGVHQDGLVHISKLAKRFVKDPHEVVKIGMPVTVTVLEVDMTRKRISLSMV